MRLGAPLLFLLALTLMAPIGSAFQFEAKLRIDQPLEASGVVLAAPTEGLYDALLQTQEVFQDEQREVVQSARLQLQLHRYATPDASGPGGTPFVEGRPQQSVREIDAHQATLTLRNASAVAEVFSYGGAPFGGGFEGAGAMCDVHDSADQPPLQFPSDPVATSPRYTYKSSWNQVTANCVLANATVTSPRFLRFYGVDLVLTSSAGQERLRTGTFVEPDPLIPGLTWRVTQILELGSQPAPVTARVPLRLHAQLQTHLLAVVGNLRSAPAEGWLRWVDLEENGQVDPWAAHGAFQIRARPQRVLDLDGETLNRPQIQTATAHAVPRALVPILVTAAGLGLLVAAIRFSWPLFTRLVPNRLLTHPRRSQLMDLVHNDPGVDLATAGRILGLSRGTLNHHVHHLRAGGVLAFRRLGRRTGLFPANEGFQDKGERLLLLRRPTHRRIYEALQTRPADQAAIARAFGLTQQRVSQALADLKRAGLVSSEKATRRRLYHAAAAGFGSTTPTPRDPI